MTIYPWQKSIWNAITARFLSEKMPHALLLTGPSHNGKNQFARALSQYILCAAPQKSQQACGTCVSCKLIQAQAHPDLVFLVPEEGKKQIRIDQIRSIESFIGCHANQGGYRIVVISPAESMNLYAANALLKSLEEPGEKTVIILISDHVELLLPTIRSRCHALNFVKPAHDVALEWLKQRYQDKDIVLIEHALKSAHGFPLAACTYMQSETQAQFATLEQGLIKTLLRKQTLSDTILDWQSLDTLFIMEWMIGVVSDILLYKVTGDVSRLSPVFREEISVRSHIDQKENTAWLRYYDWLSSCYSPLIRKVYVAPQLSMEDMIVKWLEFG